MFFHTAYVTQIVAEADTTPVFFVVDEASTLLYENLKEVASGAKRWRNAMNNIWTGDGVEHSSAHNSKNLQTDKVC